MKAEGGWTYGDACNVINALHSSGLVERASIASGGVYFDPVNETPQVIEGIKAILKQHHGGGIVDGGETQSQALITNNLRQK